MKSKHKMPCDECGKKFHNLRRLKDGRFVCYFCYKKAVPIIPYGRNRFDEYVEEQITIGVSITKSQKQFLNKRLKQLGMSRGIYFRTLLINDMEHSDE